jgi:hypothetical protein
MVAGSKEECQLAKGVCQSIEAWHQSNPRGRVIIIQDGGLPVGGR